MEIDVRTWSHPHLRIFGSRGAWRGWGVEECWRGWLCASKLMISHLFVWHQNKTKSVVEIVIFTQFLMMLKFICTIAEYELHSNIPNTYKHPLLSWTMTCQGPTRSPTDPQGMVWWQWLGRRFWSKPWPEIIFFFQFCVPWVQFFVKHFCSQLLPLFFCFHCLPSSQDAAPGGQACHVCS